jgi:FMN phosphatase YigB (HAD superfamily)
MSETTNPPRTIVFDVNETLLDMSALDPLFADAFGDKGVRRVWFFQTLQNAMSATILGSYFDAVLSTDAVRRFKPAPEAYASAAERLAVAPSEALFVAAHDWDVAGAMHAGFEAAFVARHGTALNPLEARPSIVAPDLRAIAEMVVGRTAA